MQVTVSEKRWVMLECVNIFKIFDFAKYSFKMIFHTPLVENFILYKLMPAT